MCYKGSMLFAAYKVVVGNYILSVWRQFQGLFMDNHNYMYNIDWYELIH
jgi:hypothetical protein